MTSKDTIEKDQLPINPVPDVQPSEDITGCN